VVELEERWGIYARADVTSSTIDKILGRTEETSEKIAVIFVKIGKNCDTTNSPALVQENWRKIGMTCVKIVETFERIIEI
jgi:hypothetical protein